MIFWYEFVFLNTLFTSLLCLHMPHSWHVVNESVISILNFFLHIDGIAACLDFFLGGWEMFVMEGVRVCEELLRLFSFMHEFSVVFLFFSVPPHLLLISHLAPPPPSPPPATSTLLTSILLLLLIIIIIVLSPLQSPPPHHYPLHHFHFRMRLRRPRPDRFRPHRCRLNPRTRCAS